MKIIDLLNKIANGEEVPRKIYYGDMTYYYVDFAKDYQDEEECYLFSHIFKNIVDFLNDEVEIIKDNKIEYCKGLIEYYEGLIENDTFQYVTTKTYNKAQHTIQKKINEIIDYLNSKGE